jgi:hypothetical protein
MSDTFCILPWMHLATNASGNLRVCCNSTPGKNFILKPDGTPYKLHRDDMQRAWNSETYAVIRRQLLNSERPEMCARCFGEEDAGVRSARQAWNQTWREDKQYTERAPFDIKYVDLRLSNLCNLKCRMCNPYASNMWVKEWASVETALSKSEYKRLSKMDWPEEEKTWENLFAIAHTVEEIYLTGGEPTVIKNQQRLLDYFIDNGTAKDIKLKYNTNLVKMPSWLLERWRHFKRIQLNCSIDAVGELDHYIRHPSRWQTVTENFESIQTLDNANIEIHCTVQMYNILRLPELIEWAKPYGHKIYFNILNHPAYLNITVLPNQLKQQAGEQLKPYVDLPKVQGIIDYMWHEDWSNQLPDFYKYTHTLDANRNEDFYSIVPEFKHYEP